MLSGQKVANSPFLYVGYQPFIGKNPEIFFRPFQGKTPPFLGSFSWWVFLRCVGHGLVLQAMCQGTFGQKVTTEMVSSRTWDFFRDWCWVPYP